MSRSPTVALELTPMVPTANINDPRLCSARLVEALAPPRPTLAILTPPHPTSPRGPTGPASPHLAPPCPTSPGSAGLGWAWLGSTRFGGLGWVRLGSVGRARLGWAGLGRMPGLVWAPLGWAGYKSLGHAHKCRFAANSQYGGADPPQARRPECRHQPFPHTGTYSWYVGVIMHVLRRNLVPQLAGAR